MNCPYGVTFINLLFVLLPSGGAGHGVHPSSIDRQKGVRDIASFFRSKKSRCFRLIFSCVYGKDACGVSYACAPEFIARTNAFRFSEHANNKDAVDLGTRGRDDIRGTVLVIFFYLKRRLVKLISEYSPRGVMRQ